MMRLGYVHIQLVGLELTEFKTSPTQPPNKPTEPNKPNLAKTDPTSKFYPLTSAISQLCDGKIGALVDFEAVRKQLGTKEDVKKLGWTTFTRLVKAACDSRAVELIETDPGSKYLSLLPSSSNPIDSITNSMASILCSRLICPSDRETADTSQLPRGYT
jgi:hypothetical protein